jgi:hypothetical protein
MSRFCCIWAGLTRLRGGGAFRYFVELRSQESGSRKLVLLGKATMPIPNHPDIVALGLWMSRLSGML